MARVGSPRCRGLRGRSSRSLVVALRRGGRVPRARVGSLGAHAMSPFGVVAPHLLWWLLGIPVMLAAARRRSRRAAVLRVLAACGLVLVLAGAYVRRPRPAGGACIVLAVDVSASVQRAGLDAAARGLPALASTLGPNDLVAAVAFAREARVVATPSAAPPTAAAIEPPVDAAAIARD